MRLATGPSAVTATGETYFPPERRRVADPGERARLAAYLSSGSRVGLDFRTDGAWVWPADAVRLLLERGIAPEDDFYEYIQMRGYQPAEPVADDTLRHAHRLIRSPSPTRRSAYPAVYYVRVEDDYPPEAPLSLLRRVTERSGASRDEALWRDLRWHPTHAFAIHARTGEMDLREVPPEHAAGVLDRWCAKWHDEAIAAD